MVGSDARKSSILNTAGTFFGVSLVEDKLGSTNDAAVNKFLDDSSCVCLVVNRLDARGNVECSNKVGCVFLRNTMALNAQSIFLNSLKFSHYFQLDPAKQTTFGSLVFFKTQPVAISADNYQQTVMVVSLSGSALSTLYHAMHNVFSPTLMKTAGKGLDPKLQSLISELEMGLATTLRRQKDGRGKTEDVGDGIGGELFCVTKYIQ